DRLDGVSTNLALIFGTLLSSQGADASFGPDFRALRALPSFPTLSDLSDPISSVLSGPDSFSLGAFRRFPTLSDPFGV
ncbi:hypothetical protein AB0E83_24345, partial [Streptomyces sp. NPDC035033]|uniref:hypothetical protein n=1 Tax=Streptomyces sp. NPDC035033 TaxID=3155368 RepID=UPI0033F30831